MVHFNPNRIQSLKLKAAQLHGFAIKARAAGYATGLLPVHRVGGLKVISVGNLRAGGSGKTPLAIYLAQQIQNKGVETALLLRGYKGGLESRGGVVSLGKGPLVSPDQAGDEAYVTALRLNGVMVYVGADRIANAIKAKDMGAKVVVLDDGFQHRRLFRDVEILLACPEDLDPTTQLMPAGPLREQADAAGRADLVGGLAGDWQDRHPGPDLLMEHVPTCLVQRTKGAGFSTIPIETQKGARVYLLSGIARPERFLAKATSAGLNVVGTSFYKDHHRFTPEDLNGVTIQAHNARAQAIVTTEKDLARLFSIKVDLPIWALRINLQILSGQDKLARCLSGILSLL